MTLKIVIDEESSRLYNPIFFVSFRLYNPNTFSFFGRWRFTKGWTVSGVFNAFLDGWTVKHVLFDCNYDL